jgi:hypothetical protein
MPARSCIRTFCELDASSSATRHPPFLLFGQVEGAVVKIVDAIVICTSVAAIM